jgi:uncharacterized protein (TIGR03437 family)
VFRRSIAQILLVSASVHAQIPAIRQNGVVNAASQVPPTLPGGRLARGVRFTIYGVRLTGKEGSAITLTHAPISVNARIVSAAALRIDAILPEDAPLGPAELRVQRGDQTSAPFVVTIVNANTGLYSQNGEGWGPGRIRVLESAGRDNSLSRATDPRERIAIAATGIGRASSLAVFIGGKRAKLISIRPSSEPGNEDIIVDLPTSVPEGCFVPVYAREGNSPPSNIVTLAIRRGGGACRPPPGFPIPLITSIRPGVVILSRITGMSENGHESWTDDDARAAFVDKPKGPALSPLLLAPPPGTCTVYLSSNQAASQLPASLATGLLEDLGGRGLDAGRALLVRTGQESRIIPQTPGALGYYRAPLGSKPLGRQPLFLNPGSFMLKATGGADVGAFDLILNTDDHGFRWTNRDAIGLVNRGQPLTVTWGPRRSDQFIAILATNADQFSTARALCYCLANGQAGRFTIPAAMLANFPPTYNVPGPPTNQLIVAALPSDLDRTSDAPGLDFLRAISIHAQVRIVGYK